MPAQLCVEYRENPLGIDVAKPRLSWILQSDKRGEVQRAYQILAATSMQGLQKDAGDLWDSGLVKSEDTVLVPYAGKPLVSAQQVFWKVRIWGWDGKPSAWSAPASWTMGILQETDWAQAKWISVESADSAERKGRGYHAGETGQQDELKWVQVDLGASLPISTIRLQPMVHDNKDGFGFPLRFKVEIASDPNFGNARIVANQLTADYANPGRKPVIFNVPMGLGQGRYVRITATKLWMRDATHCPFALSQLEVISGGKNVAVGKSVTAKDSVDGSGWNKESLVDGIGTTDTKLVPSFATLLLRRDFAVRPGLRRATAFVCGLGYYEMTLNGGRVTDDVLTPGWTKYNKTCLYDTYDVTRLLKPGGNAVGLFLGNGMYRVLGQGRYSKFTGSFGPQQAIAQIRLDYQDGTSAVLVTDEKWQAAPGPVTFSSVYGGEDFDARLIQPGWDQPGFAPRNWSPVLITKGPGGALKGLSSAAPPIRKFDLFKPVNTKQLGEGSTVYDLGQNAAQIPRLTVHGPAGSSVKITPAELVKGDGSVDQVSTGSPTYCVYTLAGTGQETWSPRFFYSGYRYLQVECLPAKEGGGRPGLDAIESSAVHTSSRAIGEFTTSNELLNRIWTLVRWAQRSNMVSALTDCPHREKLGWLEQIHLNGPALRYNFDLNAFFTKTMNDMSDSQLESGLIPTTAPEYTTFGGDFRDSPEWGSAFVIVAWQQYLFTGDTELLNRYYDAMVRYVAYLGRKSNGDIVSYGLSDWYDIGPNGPGNSQLTPTGVTATAFYYQDTLIVAEAAGLLGKTEDAAKFRQQAERIRDAFNKKFFDAATAQYATGSQAADSIPAVMGIASPESRDAVLKNIVSDIRQKGLTAGDVGYRYLLRALADAGRSDVIYGMVNQSEKPGYGMMLAKGATSLPEAWNAERSSSQDHFMLGQVNEWFFHDLAGIQDDPTGPGFKKFIIHPTLVGDVTFVKTSYLSVRGKIATQWKRNGNAVTLEVLIPANTSATIYVPAASAASVQESGRPAATAVGLKYLRMENGTAVFAAGGGSYRFSSVMPNAQR